MRTQDYQRRVDNSPAAQVREAVEVLDRVIKAEGIEAIVFLRFRI